MEEIKAEENKILDPKAEGRVGNYLTNLFLNGSVQATFFLRGISQKEKKRKKENDN